MSSYSKDRTAGESCTIINQRSYSYFRSFSLLNCPSYNKMDSSSIKVCALIDSGTSACFINKDFADRHKLPLVTKKHLISIEVIDRRPLVLGDVTHETTLLDIILEGHYSIIVFNVIKSPQTQLL
jgi:hypothetical protein